MSVLDLYMLFVQLLFLMNIVTGARYFRLNEPIRNDLFTVVCFASAVPLRIICLFILLYK